MFFKIFKNLNIFKNFNIFKIFKKYYILLALALSLLLGSVLFYLSELRSNELSISPVTIYCLERRDNKVCKRRSLARKRLQNRQIKKVIFTLCHCRDLRLSNVHISESDLRGGHFYRAVFQNVSFVKTNFFKSSFYGAIFENVVFEESDLGGAIFNFAVLRNVQFKNVDLSSALFIGTRFEDLSYDKATKWPFSKEQIQSMSLRKNSRGSL